MVDTKNDGNTDASSVWASFFSLVRLVLFNIFLTILFFIVLTPFALLRRAFGHDPMALKKWKKGQGSVFVTRDHIYHAEDIEHPF